MLVDKGTLFSAQRGASTVTPRTPSKLAKESTGGSVPGSAYSSWGGASHSLGGSHGGAATSGSRIATYITCTLIAVACVLLLIMTCHGQGAAGSLRTKMWVTSPSAGKIDGDTVARMPKKQRLEHQLTIKDQEIAGIRDQLAETKSRNQAAINSATVWAHEATMRNLYARRQQEKLATDKAEYALKDRIHALEQCTHQQRAFLQEIQQCHREVDQLHVAMEQASRRHLL
ncbi:hypothetical protein QJQ45_015525 [Haematococcus lacustris]|nr:hypothetical protein QJQ45_015525 [Haematococcus lacustris]